jgi:hypothetical protein
MASLRKRQHLLVVGLLLAGMLFRGLIPAGLMPASGAAAEHGAVLVVCHHGELAVHGHGGSGSAGTSVEQCPFGAAAGAAVPGVKAVFSFGPALAVAGVDWNAVAPRGSAPRLQPPARAPPTFS